jgi:hypothetical protein
LDGLFYDEDNDPIHYSLDEKGTSWIKYFENSKKVCFTPDETKML